MAHKDPRLGQIVYILVFCNILLSLLLPLDGFQFIIFFCCVTVKTIYYYSLWRIQPPGTSFGYILPVVMLIEADHEGNLQPWP